MKRKTQKGCADGAGGRWSCAAGLALGLRAAPLVWGVEPPSPAVSLTSLAEQLPLEQLGEIPIESVSTAYRF
jgi:hypothetical protein